jgi:hypothetical protein
MGGSADVLVLMESVGGGEVTERSLQVEETLERALSSLDSSILLDGEERVNSEDKNAGNDDVMMIVWRLLVVIVN